MRQGTACRAEVLGALLLGLFSVLEVGCDRDSSESAVAGATERAGDLSAREVLDRMIALYRAAKTYADSGELHQRAVVNGLKQELPAVPFSVAFERPNKLRMHGFEAMLVSDGKLVRAAIAGFHSQVLEVPAPLELTSSNFASDQFLRSALTPEKKEFAWTQIDLLLADAPLKEALQGAGPPKLLDGGKIDSRPCYRVAITSASGRGVYWIDRQSFVLRRLDLPTNRLKQEIDPQGALTGLEVWIEFTGAQLGEAIDPAAFAFDVPKQAQRVKRFVAPPADPEMQPIGKTVPDFTFSDLAGGTVDRKSLSGKVVVLDFWFTECLPCRETMPKLDQVYQRYQDDDRVRFLAVSIDRPGVADEKLTEMLREWGVTIPVVRDTRMLWDTVFQLPGAPITLLLGTDGRIHDVRVDVDHAKLDADIRRLLAGEDVAGQFLAAQEKDYQVRLASALVEPSVTSMVEVPRVNIAPRSEPASLKLTELWQGREIKQPGNILVTSGEGGAPQIFVLDGTRSVVELDVQGKTVARHELPLPEGTGVRFLRTAVEPSGNRRFAVTAPGSQQLHLLDQDWRLMWSFPKLGKHAGIADVRFVETGGQLRLLVSYLGVVGVQAVSLEGKRLWSNRSLENVWQLAVAGTGADGSETVLATSSQGTLARIDLKGRTGEEIRVIGHAIVNVAATSGDDRRPEICVLSALGLGRVAAVGIDMAGQARWNYPLPEGVHQTPIERIVAAELPRGGRGWLLPAADGSIHWVATDGRLVDRWNYGSALAGLAVTRVGGDLVLLVSSRDGFTAWKVVTGKE